MATVRKHHPRNQVKYLEMYREGQAKLEWEQKQRKVEHIKKMLLDLAIIDRLEVLNYFCSQCGNKECDCQNK